MHCFGFQYDNLTQHTTHTHTHFAKGWKSVRSLKSVSSNGSGTDTRCCNSLCEKVNKQQVFFVDGGMGRDGLLLPTLHPNAAGLEMRRLAATFSWSCLTTFFSLYHNLLLSRLLSLAQLTTLPAFGFVCRYLLFSSHGYTEPKHNTQE